MLGYLFVHERLHVPQKKDENGDGGGGRGSTGFLNA